MRTAAATIDVLADGAVELTGADADHDELLRLVGDRRFVLLGEATHGTAEFYRERARITRRLVEEKGFTAVAVEADWPDAYRLHRFVAGRSEDPDAAAALGDFRRFPAWMWRNTEIVELATWLRRHNAALGDDPAAVVGFYGLDLYSLRSSMEAVITHLDAVDPTAAARARDRYACFDHVAGEGQEYGYSVAFEVAAPCEAEVLEQLVDLRRQAEANLGRHGWVADDEWFFAEQNARVVRNAEDYYRRMFGSRVSSWNLRDSHMAETLGALEAHLRRRVAEPKIVVWEHNSHLGDARATDMGRHGEHNVGQLTRERWGSDAFLVGFTTYEGEVTAASDWGGEAERKRVRPALPGSYEEVLHDVPLERYLLPLRPGTPPVDALGEPRLERAIGVVYRPQTERSSHYFAARLPAQFDAVIHIDRTTALRPLETTVPWDEGEPPETFPTGL